MNSAKSSERMFTSVAFLNLIFVANNYNRTIALSKIVLPFIYVDCYTCIDAYLRLHSFFIFVNPAFYELVQGTGSLFLSCTWGLGFHI